MGVGVGRALFFLFSVYLRVVFCTLERGTCAEHLRTAYFSLGEFLDLAFRSQFVFRFNDLYVYVYVQPSFIMLTY